MAKNWAHAFLTRLDFINWDLPRELITNRNPKFLSKFWIILIEKLGMKLLYSIAYYPQTNGSSKKTNQAVKITLRFFVYMLENFSHWPQVLSCIQAIINNISSSIIGKISNKLAYGFSPRRLLDLLSILSTPNFLAVKSDIVEAISFVLLN